MKALDDIPSWTLAVAAVSLVAVLAVWAAFALRRRSERKSLEAVIDSIAYDVLRNVLIPNGMEGHITLPYLLLTDRGLLILDLLDRPGAIFGGDQMVEWTAITKKTRYTFRNPQHVLYDRIAALKSLAGGTPVDGRIVFGKRSDFPKGRSSHALRIDELTKVYTVVDRQRGNVVAAFADVWANIKKNVQALPAAL